jgi:hypothetical protein
MLRAAAVLLFLVAAPARGDELPLVADAEWPHLRDHVRALVQALDDSRAPLPDDTARRLRDLVRAEPADAVEAVREAQRLLDAHCLISVNINPESRVKVARGPLATLLTRQQASVVLVKIHNEGGVTSALEVSGPGLFAGERRDGAWLRCEPLTPPPLARHLGGRRVEYVPLRLLAVEAGKREALFQFSVGQGTQDLGFRAEVPVLFTVRAP